MTIREYRGCTSGGLIVDGVPTETKDQEVAVLDRLIPLLREGVASGTVSLSQVIHLFPYDDSEMGETCDQCGDWPCTTTWNL